MELIGPGKGQRYAKKASQILEDFMLKLLELLTIVLVMISSFGSVNAQDVEPSIVIVLEDATILEAHDMYS